MDTLQGKLFWHKDDYITSLSENTNIIMDQIHRKWVESSRTPKREKNKIPPPKDNPFT